MALGPGTQVNPRVKLLRRLGEGGMGAVWVAEHTTLDAEVAVKFVSSSLDLADPAVLSRFRREASVAAKLKTPHVVKTFDHGVMDDGTPYIVMELLDGESLAERLGRRGTLTLAQTATLLGQTAQVLDEAHALGVVHRDIKPDNLFLVESPYELFVKVLDFGIAKQTAAPSIDGATSTGTIVGTPEYMSPERLLSNEPADARADLWALTVVAYRSITGRIPFTGDTVTSLCIAICKGAFPLPSAVRSEIPPALDPWFQRAMHPQSEERFDTGAQLAEAFAEVVASLPADIPGTPVPTDSRDSTSSGRARLLRLKAAVEQSDLPSTKPEGKPDIRVTPGGEYAVGTLGGSLDTVVAADDARPRDHILTTAVVRQREQDLHRWSMGKVAAITIGGFLLAAGVRLLLKSPPAHGEGGDTTSRPAASAALSTDDLGDTVSEPAEPTAPTVTATASSTADVPRTAAPATRPPTRPPPRTGPEPTGNTATPAVHCDQPYYVDEEGIEHIKPECLH